MICGRYETISIVDARRKGEPTPRLRDIEKGSVFLHGDDIYMKSDEALGHGYRVFRMRDGRCTSIGYDEQVTPLRASLEVRDIA